MNVNLNIYTGTPVFKAKLLSQKKYAQIIPRDKRLELNKENVKKAMAEGLRKIDMCHLFGINRVMLDKFFASNKDFNYEEYKKKKVPNILESLITAEELSQKFDIAVSHAKFILDGCYRTGVKKDRICRLIDEVPLYKKGKSLYYIAKILSYPEITVQKDIRFYLEHQKKLPNL